ncbi:hypothetical protein [Streptomyces sp. Ru72]|uniref:hypothetical protein n=1 Tax=Streptomyces sp. Ru72 TaxID=2080747 RepID=UPI0011B02DB2|nr:hypothetical protein [Streptomyces sp. Ru72]
MRTRAVIAAALLLGAAATACSSDAGAKPAPTVTVTQTVTAAPSTEAADSNAGVLKTGTQKAVDDGLNNIHTTVQARGVPAALQGPPA